MALKLKPIGQDVDFSSLSIVRLKRIISHVLSGLSWLHSNGFVHRDLTWSSVVQDPNGNYRLRNLECAEKVEKSVPYVNHRAREVMNLTGAEIYKPRHDLYMLAEMIEESSNNQGLDNETTEFTDFLRRCEAVGQILWHGWLRAE